MNFLSQFCLSWSKRENSKENKNEQIFQIEEATPFITGTLFIKIHEILDTLCTKIIHKFTCIMFFELEYALATCIMYACIMRLPSLFT